MKTLFNSKKGFSLAEIMVATTISAFILTSAYATIMSLAKGSESMINFSEMNGQTRVALELFGRDMRMASDVETASEQVVKVQKKVYIPSSNANIACDITYEFVPSAETFTRTIVRRDTGTTIEDRILLYDVDALKFTYYSLINPTDPWVSPAAHNPLEVKHVQIEAKLQRNVLNLKNTNYIISARFMMRNKDVSYL